MAVSPEFVELDRLALELEGSDDIEEVLVESDPSPGVRIVGSVEVIRAVLEFLRQRKS